MRNSLVSYVVGGVKALPALGGVLVAVAFLSLVVSTPWSASPSDHSEVTPWDMFFSVAHLGGDRWWVVGKNGALLSSTDGGLTWARRALARRGDHSWYDLYSIRFAPDGVYGWISGEDGLILHSEDGGATWTPQTSGVKAHLFRTIPIDASHVVAAGADGNLLWTYDGGRQWHGQVMKNGITFFDAAFGDATNGWAVGEFSAVAHTSDGGITWAMQTGGNRTDFRAPAYLHTSFADARRGWVAGQGGKIVGTEDGGITWHPVNSPVDVPVYGGDIGPDSLWLVGSDGVVLSLRLNGSVASTINTRPTFSTLVEVAVANQTALAVGDDGAILRSTDGGKNWEHVGIR